MALYYVMLLMTLCALAGVFEASPMSRALFHTEENPGDKRGGIPSRFRGNSFRQSIHPALERRAPPTIFRSVESEGEDEMEPPTRRRLISRDYLFSVLGMGARHGSTGHHGLNHNHYNNHYYYDDYSSNNDYNSYEYDEYYDQYPEEYYSEEASSESDEAGSRQEKALDSQKAKQTAVKRKTPTLTKKGLENELEEMKEQKRRTPTAENNRFLQALKRYMNDARFDDVRRK